MHAVPSLARRLLRLSRATQPETRMAIQWQHDLGPALGAAAETHKPVLLDFSAAPM
jgi:hypothetical protein